MIRAVIFDLDGTLFDRATTVERVARSQFHAYREYLPGVDASNYVRRLVELDNRGYTSKLVVFPAFLAELGVTDLDPAAMVEDFYQRYHQHAVVYDGTLETLDHLRSKPYKLGIITNGHTSIQRGTLEALQLDGCFDEVLISEQEGVRKPDSEIFHRAVSRLGVAPAEAVYVGDHPETDVAGARRAGLRAIWRRDSYWPAPSEADGIIEHLSELVEICDRWAAK